MSQLFLNNFDTTFIAAVKDAATSGTPATELDYGILRISDGAAGALINPAAGDYYVLTAFKRSGTSETNIEIMRVTAVDNSTPGECRITVLRGQEGTPVRAYVAGDYLSLRWTKGAAQNLVQSDDARLTDARAPTGGAGGVLSGSYPNPGFAVDMATQAELDAVAAAKQDTLVSGTNIKTVGGTSILGSGNIPVGTGDVTLTGTQTLTNKTLTAAILNAGYTEQVFALSGTTPALDEANGSIQTWTLSGASTPTDALSSGQSLILGITAGANTITWPSVTWVKVGGSGTAPTLTSSGVNWVILWKVGTTMRGAFLGTA